MSEIIIIRYFLLTANIIHTWCVKIIGENFINTYSGNISI